MRSSDPLRLPGASASLAPRAGGPAGQVTETFRLKSATTRLSVVLASVSGKPYLDDCLAALVGQARGDSTEIIVADRLGDEVGDFVRDRYPEVRLLCFERLTGVPELRARAIDAAVGEVVAIVGDYCVPARDWCREVASAHARHEHLAIGGSVDARGVEDLVNRAAFLCEYSAFVSPVADDEVDELPGPNVSYKRRQLAAASELLETGYWETLLHRELAQQGHTLRSEPRIRVLYRKHCRLGGFCRERYHFGRAFAAARNEHSSRARRLVHVLGAPVLPLLLTLRVARKNLCRHRFGHFLAVAPLIVLFMAAASVGEWMGYTFGRGRSTAEFA